MDNIIFSPFDLKAKHGGAKIFQSHKVYNKVPIISTSNFFEYKLIERISSSKYSTFLPYLIISTVNFLFSFRAIIYLFILSFSSKKKISIVAEAHLSLIHIFLSFFCRFDYCIIHDCPLHFINNYPYSLSFGKFYLKLILNNSNHIKVVSNGMIDQYKKLVKENKKIDFEIELGGVKRKLIEKFFIKKKRFLNSEKRKIIMAGSGHLGGRVKFKDDELINLLHIFGTDFKDYDFIITDLRYKKFCNYQNVHFTPWLSKNELDNLFLSKCIGFAYDLSSPKYSEFAYLSFPTKIQYYLCLSTPFIYLGPAKSSVYSLLSSSNSGCYIFNDFLSKDIKSQFDHIFENYEEYSKNAKSAGLKFFGIND